MEAYIVCRTYCEKYVWNNNVDNSTNGCTESPTKIPGMCKLNVTNYHYGLMCWIIIIELINEIETLYLIGVGNTSGV